MKPGETCHLRCKASWQHFPGPFLITWVCLLPSLTFAFQWFFARVSFIKILNCFLKFLPLSGCITHCRVSHHFLPCSSIAWHIHPSELVLDLRHFPPLSILLKAASNSSLKELFLQSTKDLLFVAVLVCVHFFLKHFAISILNDTFTLLSLRFTDLIFNNWFCSMLTVWGLVRLFGFFCLCTRLFVPFCHGCLEEWWVLDYSLWLNDILIKMSCKCID